ncbi:MAG: hypothetical protein JWL59_5133 [Chthoniobacteraceae bacterium]|nr:hypothetical protein [Chthoniobacteraceae bacterium]
MPLLFVAVGQNGYRIASQDGVDWKNLQIGKEGETYRAVAFGLGRFVAVGSYGGDNIYAASSDGVAWETGKKEAKYSKYIRGLGFDGRQFLGVGGDPGSVGASGPFVVTSPDGKTWSDYISVSGKAILRRLAFGKGVVVGVGDRGRRAVSNDGGTTWIDAPGTKPIDTLADITFGAVDSAGNGRFVGVGLHGLRMQSQDGLTWSAPERGNEGEHLNSVVWTGEKFTAIGAGATYFSLDGIEWKREPNLNAPLTACFGGGLFVGTQWKGRLLVSTDALAWKEVHKADEHFEAIAFGSLA